MSSDIGQVSCLNNVESELYICIDGLSEQDLIKGYVLLTMKTVYAYICYTPMCNLLCHMWTHAT